MPYISSTIFLSTSGHKIASLVDQLSAGTVPADRAGTSLSDLAPVNSHSCAIRLQGSVVFQKDIYVKCVLYAISATASTGHSADTQEDEFHCEPPNIVISSNGADSAVVAGDCNGEVGKRSVPEACSSRY